MIFQIWKLFMKIYKFNKDTCKIDEYDVKNMAMDEFCFVEKKEAVYFGYNYLLRQRTIIKHQLLDFKIENGLD